MGRLLLEAYLRSLQVYKHRFLTGIYIHSVAMPTASGELGIFNTLDHVGEKTGKRRAEYVKEMGIQSSNRYDQGRKKREV